MKLLFVARRDGRSQAFRTLVAAQARAEQWAREIQAPVEVWSWWTGERLLVVLPDGRVEIGLDGENRVCEDRILRRMYEPLEVEEEE